MDTPRESLTLLEWAQRAYWVLEPARNQDRVVNYEDLADAIGYPSAIWHEEFSTILYIVFLADPNVAARAVSKKNGAPGKGFWRAVDSHGASKKLDASVVRPDGM